MTELERPVFCSVCETAHLREDRHTLPPIWQNGPPFSAWRKSMHYGLWYTGGVTHMPDTFCLGNRMIHISPGIDIGAICWRGSSSCNWHGWDFGVDLQGAIQWVQAAIFKEFGQLLWSNPFGVPR